MGVLTQPRMVLETQQSSVGAKKNSFVYWSNVRLVSECNLRGSISDCFSKSARKCSFLRKSTVHKKWTAVKKMHNPSD